MAPRLELYAPDTGVDMDDSFGPNTCHVITYICDPDFYDDVKTPTPTPTSTSTPMPPPDPPKVTMSLTMPGQDEFWHYRGGWKIATFVLAIVWGLLWILGLFVCLYVRINKGNWKDHSSLWIPLWGTVIILTVGIPLVWLTWFAPLDQYDYENAGEYEQAIEHWSVEIYQDEENPWNLIRRAGLYNYLGQYQQAIQDYDEAIRLEPEEPVFYNNRGVAYGDLGRSGLADRDFAKACKVDAGWC
jgi:hypothetical protein